MPPRQLRPVLRVQPAQRKYVEERSAGEPDDTPDPDGDIAIAYTGLRSGEKLYEELLIGANTKATEHPRIWRSDEPFQPSDELARELEILNAAMDVRDFDTMHAVLLRNVEGYSATASMPPGEDGSPAVWTPASRTLH